MRGRRKAPRWARDGRRGISEIVSTLLMLAIVVSLGVLVFTFASGSLGSLSQGFSNLVTSQGDAVKEQFVVEQATFTFSGTAGADLYVRNVGSVSSSLVSVYVVDQSTGDFVVQIPTSTSLTVGDFVDIPHTTISFAPAHGHTYSFTVTSSRGNSVTYDARAA